VLEVVTSAVWENPIIENVKLANDPRVETTLRERVDENLVIPNLHVANTSPEAADRRRRSDRTEVVVMKDPSSRGRLAVQPRQLNELARDETVALSC